MSEEEYEGLGDGAPLATVMTAGAAAGVMEHCVMLPVDCVKTRMQALACDKSMAIKSSSIWKNLLHIQKTEGFWRPLHGVQPLVLGAGPAHAVYFACYEQIKSLLLPANNSGALPEYLVHGGAGAAATVLHDAVMTPADVVKQRLQMCCSPYKSAWDCTRSVYNNEGLRAFYRSYTTMLSMNIPFQAVHFIAYEQMMNWLNPSRDYVPEKHFVSGAVAGGVAATVTMPWDVAKTLLNTQEANVLTRLNTTKVVGLTGAFRTVYNVAGLRGFFQGWRARVLYQAPATAISWSVYEGFKWWNFGRDDASSRGYENTIEDLRAANQRSSRAEWSEAGEREERRDVRLWDQIVTDMPRPHVVRAEAGVNSDLVVRDRTFPGYRT